MEGVCRGAAPEVSPQGPGCAWARRFRDNKVTEAQRQWWNHKAANFDSVLLFKVRFSWREGGRGREG